ncbi:translesion error-prone DNA polymerase V autoproteolytic subunit [Providencia rettgeri]|uniref:translesion error-prone DNA polymerase V autoproteolytic subunit n=1 Tax=Providencia rettgeri TaxID=587 RepID=UPI00244ADCC2|nr:translesion error-prone DNA polymerase V autoproteolytic subunit [Providencia rettgeri]MDH2398179.1 translesion error-prone DNA polymerase V autoproteolytic subunit [Providencia rettgeri]
MKLELIDSESIINIPLFLDRVPAGFPSPAADYMEERINLNSTLIKHPDSTYMLRVEGNSMIDANINDGDVVIVDSALTAKDGDIVIASVDGEFTVKRLNSNPPMLMPMNPEYSPILIGDMQDLQIFGVVTYIIHKAV